MKYKEMGIETRREAPAQVRIPAEAMLMRAGFLLPDGQVTGLGQRLIARLARSGPIMETLTAANLAAFQLGNGTLATATPVGDLELLRCPDCGYANERDLARVRKSPPASEPELPLTRAATPRCNTIDLLAAFLGIPKERTAKAMMYTRRKDGILVFAAVRGDMQISQRKLQVLVGELRPAKSDEIVAAGAVPGYASPIGLHDALVVVDDLLVESPNMVVGANEAGFHYLHANYGRDFTAELSGDIVLSQPGDSCWRCGGLLDQVRGIIASDAVGIRSRAVLLALADVCMDQSGLAWPAAIAPFDVHLVQLSSNRLDTRPACDALAASLEAAGIEVLYDDRDARPGVKFKDADLIGCPVRITVGERSLGTGSADLKRRDRPESQGVELSKAKEAILELLGELNA